jgi:hypothetical protein
VIDGKTLREHLAMADRHVGEGERNVSKQRALVAELQRDGHDAWLASKILRQFEALQATFIQDRERLRRELAQFG